MGTQKLQEMVRIAAASVYWVSRMFWTGALSQLASSILAGDVEAVAVIFYTAFDETPMTMGRRRHKRQVGKTKGDIAEARLAVRTQRYKAHNHPMPEDFKIQQAIRFFFVSTHCL